MLTAKTFTAAQLKNANPGTLAPTMLQTHEEAPPAVLDALLEEAKKLECELLSFKTLISGWQWENMSDRKKKRYIDDAIGTVKNFMVHATSALLEPHLSTLDPNMWWGANESAFDTNETLIDLTKKCKHLITAIDTGEHHTIPAQTHQIIRYLKKKTTLAAN